MSSSAGADGGVGRALAVAAGGFAAALPGALPSVTGGPDPLALLAWLAFAAPAVGCAVGALGLSLWPFGLAVPGSWMILCAALDLASERDLPEPLWAALAFSGLYALGLGLGARGRGAPWRGAGLCLLLTALLSGLSVRGGLTRASWAETSPRAARALFELSPQTLVIECAGVDWMRSGAVYRAAGTDWFAGRRGYRGSLAGPLVFVVGCAAALVLSRRGRRIASRAGAGAGPDPR